MMIFVCMHVYKPSVGPGAVSKWVSKEVSK